MWEGTEANYESHTQRNFVGNWFPPPASPKKVTLKREGDDKYFEIVFCHLLAIQELD